MSRLSNIQLINSIQNGDEDILFYLTGKYFQSARRWLRRNGCKDSDTPTVFSYFLIRLCREIQQNKISPNIDFEPFLFNSLREYFINLKRENDSVNISESTDQLDIIESCFSIVDETSRKLLSERYVEKLSFEQIAVRHSYSNPVIAQFEFDKAYSQFEKIIQARLNMYPE